MRRVLIDEDRFSVSLPGENVTTAGLSGMAFDSRFASIERAVGGTFWMARPFVLGNGHLDGPRDASINFGIDFGAPPFFLLAAGRQGPLVGGRVNSTEYDMSHVIDFELRAVIGHGAVALRNGDQVIANNVSPTFASIAYFYYRDGHGGAGDYPIKWLALA